jgi:hypothetical protein
MAYIKIEHESNHIKLQIDGTNEELSRMLRYVIYNEPNLALLIIDALDQPDPFDEINLN